MKGTDCTPGQLVLASAFLADRGWKPDGPEKAFVGREDIVRVVAWYGALRYRAGRDGTGGTFETPGPVGPVGTEA